MHGIFTPLPYSGNFLSVHGNTSTADYDSMSFFAVYTYLLNADLKDFVGV
jgi:hypothetical protein